MKPNKERHQHFKVLKLDTDKTQQRNVKIFVLENVLGRGGIGCKKRREEREIVGFGGSISLSF